MPVVRMQLLQLVGKGIGVVVGEFLFAESPHRRQHIQRPAALLGADLLERFDALELSAHLGCGRDFARLDHLDASLDGDATQIKIAADPAGTARGRSQRLTPDDGRCRKGEMRHQQQVPDAPVRAVVIHEEEIRRLVAHDGPHHGIVSAICDVAVEGPSLPLELVAEAAAGAGKVQRLGVVLQPVQLGRGAIGAVKILFAPGLGDDAHQLGQAFVSPHAVG